MHIPEITIHEDVYSLPKYFGVFCNTISETATLLSRMMFLQGQLDRNSGMPPYIGDDVSQRLVYDEKNDKFLKKDLSRLKEMFLRGIKNNTLETQLLRFTDQEEIDSDRTYLDMREVVRWLNERKITVSGDWLDQYFEDETNLIHVAIDKIRTERFKCRNIVQIADGEVVEDQVAELQAECSELRNSLMFSGVKLPFHNDSRPSLRTIEKETLLKLLLGLVLTNYTYDPKALRNSTAREIVDDLQLHGLSIDADTVRKWLNEAKELLPQDAFQKDD